MEAKRNKLGQFVKGNIPWSKEGLKGIRVSPDTEFKEGFRHTNETRKKMSESRKGIKVSEQQRQKIRNTLMGHSVSAETRQKISINNKGKLMGRDNPAKRPEVREKIRLSKLGDRNASWQGGITAENHRVRGYAKYKKWKELVFGRDEYTCVRCLSDGEELNAHHIIPLSVAPEEALELDNGATLCVPCHKSINY